MLCGVNNNYRYSLLSTHPITNCPSCLLSSFCLGGKEQRLNVLQKIIINQHHHRYELTDNMARLISSYWKAIKPCWTLEKPVVKARSGNCNYHYSMSIETIVKIHDQINSISPHWSLSSHRCPISTYL